MEAQFPSLTYLIFPEVKQSPLLSDTPSFNKQLEQEDIFEKTNSLQMLGSNINISQAFSAFSIYDPKRNKAQSTQVNEKQNMSQIQDDFDEINENSRSTRKKIGKDKKEVARLETKNLNRFFRSKINEMLRDIKEDPDNEEDGKKANELLIKLNSSNKIMFSQMREIMRDEWLQERLKKCESILMRYIHRGKMGMSSKLVMLKQFEVPKNSHAGNE